MKPSIYNALSEICDGCPYIDAEVSTMFRDGKHYMITVDCTHKGECRRAYDIGRKEALNEMR